VIGGQNSIETDRNDESHGDRFWAAALGLDAAGAVADAYREAPAALPRSSKPRRA
jgi:phage FluMu gp28-like protein